MYNVCNIQSAGHPTHFPTILFLQVRTSIFTGSFIVILLISLFIIHSWAPLNFNFKVQGGHYNQVAQPIRRPWIMHITQFCYMVPNQRHYIYRTLGRTTESAKERTRIRAKARTPRLEIFRHKFHFLKFSPFFVLDYFDHLFKKFSFCRNFKSLKLYLSVVIFLDD